VADEVFALEGRPEEVLARIDEVFGRPAERGKSDALLPRGALRGARTDARAFRREVRQELVALGRTVAERAGEYGELDLPPDPPASLPLAAAQAARAADRLEAVADTVERLSEGREEEPALERAVSDLRGAGEALRLAFRPGLASAVAAFEGVEAPFDRWRLVVRAVSPAEAFHERFASRLETLACVSASLFVGEDAFAALGELEIEERAETPVRRVLVESPFPYAEHMRVVALRGGGDLVEETAAVLAELSRRLGGRTLGLFTSLRRMRQVGDALADTLRRDGFDVLSPRRAGDDPAALVERFARAGGGSVLLGARTFWQGLDVPGPALSAVVIEKLPFEVPTELRRRREERLRAAGEDAFGRYTLGKMLLNLKQMVGRLIRNEDDRGIVVIVEARPEKAYFRQLVRALPPQTVVTVARREELSRVLAEVGIAGPPGVG